MKLLAYSIEPQLFGFQVSRRSNYIPLPGNDLGNDCSIRVFCFYRVFEQGRRKGYGLNGNGRTAFWLIEKTNFIKRLIYSNKAVTTTLIKHTLLIK